MLVGYKQTKKIIKTLVDLQSSSLDLRSDVGGVGRRPVVAHRGRVQVGVGAVLGAGVLVGVGEGKDLTTK